MSGGRLRAGVLRVFAQGRRWIVPLLLLLAVLIVAALAHTLANLDLSVVPAPRPPDEGGEVAGEASGPLSNAILRLVLFSVAAVALAGIAIVLYEATRGMSAKKIAPWEMILPALAVVLLIFLLLSRGPELAGNVNETADPEGTQEASDPTGGEGSGLLDGSDRVLAAVSRELFLAGSVFAAIVWLLYVLRRGARRRATGRSGPPDFPEVRQAAASAVQEAIHELEIGEDVRTAILACFQRFCLLLGKRGIGEQRALTPRELEHLAVERLRFSRDASATLTSLFEEARYSQHLLGERERGRAIDSLGRIQAGLEA